MRHHSNQMIVSRYEVVPFAKGTEMEWWEAKRKGRTVVTKLSPSRRGLKYESSTAFTSTGAVTKLSPSRRGLKYVEALKPGTQATVTKLSPSRRGLKYVPLSGGTYKNIVTKLSPSRRGLKYKPARKFDAGKTLRSCPLREGD